MDAARMPSAIEQPRFDAFTHRFEGVNQVVKPLRGLCFALESEPLGHPARERSFASPMTS